MKFLQNVTAISAILLTVTVLSSTTIAKEQHQLPAWFDGNRVQAHTRLLLHLWGEKPIFYTAAEEFQKMGANVFTRFVKGGQDACWWPSSIGAVRPEAENFNFVQKMIDNAHGRGMRMIGYYRHMADEAMAEKHPEWICRRWDGKIIPEAGKRPIWLCLNTGFREFIKTRLLELADMGIDGFYFDYLHMPGSWLGKPTYMYTCSCQTCRKKFEKIYGRKMPLQLKWDDPGVKILIDFYNRNITEVFEYWTKAIRQRNPDCVMIVSCTFTPSMYSPVMPSSFAAVADSAKTEWNKACVWPREIPNGVLEPDEDMRWAAGFTYLRRACDDRPPHMWINALWTAPEALSATAACLTYGQIANLCTNEDEIPNMAFKPAFDLGNKVSPHLKRTKPMPWAAIHFSEKWRDHFWPDNEKIWENVLWPAYGPFEALCRARLPVTYVTDWQLEAGKLEGYKVLVIPAPTALTPLQQKVVANFKSQGGTVIEIGPATRFDKPDQHDRNIQNFLKRLLKAAGPGPIKITGGPQDLHAVVWEKTNGKATTITLLNTFKWFNLHGRIGKKLKDYPQLIKSPPPPARGVTATLRSDRTPKKVFDAVTDKILKSQKTQDGWQVRIPDFQYMAAIVFQW
ncbi:MAG: hypothetical protein JSV03_13960 [Planctomycetota bacterium]|nr:MAG: hypothetical protein JSV03_13960 [Planctomycetota bacterium]